MSAIFDNFQALVRQYKRDSARAYLTAIGRDHLNKHPQMCCYSFDDISVEVNIDGLSDKAALECLKAKFGSAMKGRAVLDIGANIGNHTLFFSDIAAQILSFEPHPITYQLLVLNARNKKNVVTFNKGASDKVGIFRAVSPAKNRGATTISDRPILDGEEAWNFEVERLDQNPDVLAADVCLIKIDVEGHEYNALLGLKGILSNKKPIIVIEQNSHVIENGKSCALDFLSDSGYTHFYSIDVEIPWRTPQSWPRIIRKCGRAVEAIIFGAPDFRAEISRVDSLEKRDYPMLVATAEPLILS